ncbi:hypothetical protein IQ274_27770 [Nostoc sp. LEGE 12447]|uniref:hypothetical protein n=1 Tax=Nostoc sp. LEGE 12447 TaxID=1828640 RepID=UPI001684327F|nr:hypothetical protein [Nostoc sp. LEGE 12447]MBD2511496.1 hypothetical protein [Desmonostoc muscorum FACHB-395]MBE9001896.1 hypothetical protein [Nostoc sp. LEGE 12447]
MLKGINLTLMVGPVVPIPVSQDVIEALTSITVTNSSLEKSGFQLTFSLSNRSPLQTLFLLSGGSIFPIIRVIIIVTINGIPNVLMDGMITNHQITPGTETSYSTLTVTGEDLTVIMDKQDFSGFPFPATPAEGRVALLVAKYAFLGIVPLIIPSVLIDVPIPTNSIPAQQGTDLSYIKELADRVGYTFYIEPGPIPGANIAYWGPQIKVGVPQSALNINMDAFTNVESLNFTFDNNLNAIPTVYIYNEITKVVIPIPIPPITPLNPPLGLIPPIPTRLEPISDNLSKRSIPQAIMMGLAKASQLAEAVTGEGNLDVLRYGRILKARQLVGVRGAGLAFDGLHYVTSVTHNIKRGEYKQSFKLSRNGLISTLPVVVP